VKTPLKKGEAEEGGEKYWVNGRALNRRAQKKGNWSFDHDNEGTGRRVVLAEGKLKRHVGPTINTK